MRKEEVKKRERNRTWKRDKERKKQEKERKKRIEVRKKKVRMKEKIAWN